jgi:formylglycine-generating enzyme required for sulfatase activity
MRGFRIALYLLFAALAGIVNRNACAAAAAQAPAPGEGFIVAAGARLQYLDWGGSGPALVLIPGLGDDPHIFTDLAMALTDHFHVISYARRGFAGSEGVGPYDIETLTEDLTTVMDALELRTATLVGISAGADEMTATAAKHPERVRRVIYLDGAYDWESPDWRSAIAALPGSTFERPVGATASFDAFLSYQWKTWYPDLPDPQPIEALMREKVIVQRDGKVIDRTPAQTVSAHLSALWTHEPHDYRAVRCPALAVYLETMYDLHTQDQRMREGATGWEERYWKPFQEKSAEHARREIARVTLVHLPGAHVNFLVMEPQRIAAVMREWLDRTEGEVTMAPRAGMKFRDCPDCPSMAVIPPGHFTMTAKAPSDGRKWDDPEGISKSAPAKDVTIDKPFAAGEFDITRDEYAAFVRDTHTEIPKGCYVWNGDQWVDDASKSWSDPGFAQTGRDPVVCVNWQDAQDYVRWLNRRVLSHLFANQSLPDGKYRLLTWEESEYSARAGGAGKYSWGTKADHNRANYGADRCSPCLPAKVGKDRWAYTSPVGSFPANRFGLYDMAGDVWQWTDTCWRVKGTAPTSACGASALRGGSWLSDADYLQTGEYIVNSRVNRNTQVGFRVARSFQ